MGLPNPKSSEFFTSLWENVFRCIATAVGHGIVHLVRVCMYVVVVAAVAVAVAVVVVVVVAVVVVVTLTHIISPWSQDRLQSLWSWGIPHRKKYKPRVVQA